MAKMTEQRILDIAKTAKKMEVQEQSKAALRNLTKEYSEWEAVLWPTLKAEAEQFKADGTIGEYMSLEIGLKYDADGLADLILAKAGALKVARAAIILDRQNKEMAIDALTTLEEVQRYK